MAFTGYLSKFSLPEILEFLEQGYKTGLLSISALNDNPRSVSQNHYIWLRQGRIVAAANRLDNQGLISMIARRGWISEKIAKDNFQASGARVAIGLCLKSQGLITAEQLTLIFRTQIMGQMSPLFELENGKFDFDSQALMPAAEMTGLSMLTNEAIIKGLRSLRNWFALKEKLPDPTSGISKKIAIPSQLQLDSQESRVWEYANSQTSLNKIANLLLIPLEKVQQIAFRLIVSNLAEEAFIVDNSEAPIFEDSQEFADLDSTNGFGDFSSQAFKTDLSNFNKNQPIYTLNSQEGDVAQVENNVSEPIANARSEVNVSQSFLHNLVGFLKTKVET